MIAFSDDFMEYNELTGQFMLTEPALMQVAAIDLRARLDETAAINPDAVLNRFLNTVSNHVYMYMFDYNGNNACQKELVRRSMSARNILFLAMIEQAQYVAVNGDLTLSADAKERENYLSPMAAKLLGTTIPEYGVSLLYAGV